VEVQRLDQTLEQMRREAETYGGVTIRGSELLRDALARVEAIDARLRSEPNELGDRWTRARSLIQSLTKTYRLD
jgi:hypothetical protein